MAIPSLMVSFVTLTQPRLTGKRISTRGTLSWPVGTFVRECVNKFHLHGRHSPVRAAPSPRWSPELSKSEETKLSTASK